RSRRPLHALRAKALRRRPHGQGIGSGTQSPQQCFRAQPGTAALRARRVRPILRQQHADVHLVAARLEPCEETLRAIPDLLVPRALAVDDPASLLIGELAPWPLDRDAALARKLQEVVLALIVRRCLPGPDRAALEGLRLIRNDQAVVNADGAAESAALLAGSEGRIERKDVRCRILVVDVAIRAVQFTRKSPRAAERRFARRVGLRNVDAQTTASDRQRRLDRI